MSMIKKSGIITICGREDAGTVDAPIGRHPVDRKKMAIDHRNGRPAVTHWSVLGRYPGYTHVECRLETGRTHQIRVHLASIGHPLLGDVVYGSRKPWPGLAGQCLHARKLKFVHPTTGKPVELVHAPLEHRWGQRVVRLYDPDGHIIEVGENMKAVCRRFLDSGMTPEEAARRMDVPVKFVRACMR